jgi:[NiFe] hydrogenase assembly HybE family chaperone
MTPDPVVAARVAEMLDAFRQVDATMRGLPFYNDTVPLETHGFARHDHDAMIGVLITPWFMNVMIVPLVADMAINWNRMGEKRLVDLPAGPRHFIYGGDETLGVWWMHSLASPMDKFKLPGQAMASARQAFAALMTPPEEEAPAPAVAARPALDRRALLRGRLSAAG